MKSDIKQKFIPGETRIKYGGAYVGDEERQAIESVLDRNWWTIDEHGYQFEKELSEKIGKKHATLTNSGSSALFVMYRALREKLNSGGEIILGAVQFPTTVSTMVFNGFTPVYIDVEADTFCLDPILIEQAITKNTVAIVATSIAGNIPNIQELIHIAKKYNLYLLLDNADGFGGKWEKNYIEHYFDIAITSFHAAHILNTGEGGCVFTDDDFFGDVASSVREWGRVGDTDDTTLYPEIPDDYPNRYIFKYLGMNLKPLELQCAMGREQLKKLELIKKLRSNNFNALQKKLEDNPFVVLPYVFLEADPSWFSFPFIAEDRKKLRNHLESKNIETRTIFGGNITKQPAFRGLGRIATPTPNADIVMDSGMFISVHPNNTINMMDYIAEEINSFYHDK